MAAFASFPYYISLFRHARLSKIRLLRGLQGIFFAQILYNIYNQEQVKKNISKV
jgi:hypothetical protein